jgi:hypothetical protein
VVMVVHVVVMKGVLLLGCKRSRTTRAAAAHSFRES